MLNVLYIIDSLRSGGKERRLVSLIEGLLRLKKVKISLVILSTNIHYEQIFDFHVNIYHLARDIRKDLMIIQKFKQIISKENPDIVHCWDNIAAMHFGPICRIKRIPFINSMITAAPEKPSILSKAYLSKFISYPFSTVVLSNSKAGLISFRVPKKKGMVIYNGFDSNRLAFKESKNYITEKYKITTSKIVGMTASFTDSKDHVTFVRAAEILFKKNNDVTFITIGDGPNMMRIKKMVSPELINNFLFLGRIVDVESIINCFDIGVLATYTEGISNAIIEYMALSKPVIATSGGGTQELVVDGVTGFLIKKRDPLELASKIDYLLSNQEIAEGMGLKGRERVLKIFSLEKMIEKTHKLYLNVVN